MKNIITEKFLSSSFEKIEDTDWHNSLDEGKCDRHLNKFGSMNVEFSQKSYLKLIKTVFLVSCGNNKVTTCAECPVNGHKCKGDCKWVDGQCGYKGL